MMQIDELKAINVSDVFDRTQRQLIAAAKWRFAPHFGGKSSGNGTIHADTGFGKTRLTIDCIIKPVHERKPTSKIVILVHRVELVKQWEERLAETTFTNSENIIVVSVQTLIANNMTISCHLLVIDELHQFYGDVYSKFVDGTRIQSTFKLGLTATPYYADKRHERILSILPVIDEVTRDECIKKGWVANYIEYNIAVELNIEESNEYVKAMSDYQHFVDKFNGEGFKAIHAVSNGAMGVDGNNNPTFFKGEVWAKYFALQLGYYEGMTREHPDYKFVNPGAVRGYAKNAFAAMQRKEYILNHAKAKYNAVIDILREYPSYKTMVFSEATSFADNIYNRITTEFNENEAVVYHSLLASSPLKDENGNWITIKSGANKGSKKLFGLKTLKDRAIEKFKSGKARVLCTARVLDEFFNDENIRVGIVTSRSSSNNQDTQRKGRILRIIPDAPKDVMLIFNVVCINTDEEYKLRRIQNKNKNDVQWISSIDEITEAGNNVFKTLNI